MGFFANYRGGIDANISVLIITSDNHQVDYSIKVPSIGYYQNGTLSAGDEIVLNISNSVQVSSHHDQNKGIHVTTSSENVTVIGQNSIFTGSTDAFFALPTAELDDPYVYYGITVPRATHSGNYNSSILIVGTDSNTIMKLTVTQYVTIGVGNSIINLIPGTQYSFVVNRLQTIYVGSPDDLSGSKVVTDKPVSVFSGHECANVPSNATYCSHLIEQIPPITLWGKVYYTVPLVNKMSYTIKILAAYHSTTVNMYCNNILESYIINGGEFISKTSMNGYCAIYSNKEVLVAQLSHGGSEDSDNGDPMMTLVPATNQYLNRFDFSTIRYPLKPGYNHYVNIIVMEQYYEPNLIHMVAEGVDRSLAAQQWIPIQVNNFAEAYATQVIVSGGITQIVHTDPTAQMTAIVYGFARHDGYGYIGGIQSYNESSQTATPTGC